jgi:hypothetical protein
MTQGKLNQNTEGLLNQGSLSTKSSTSTEAKMLKVVKSSSSTDSKLETLYLSPGIEKLFNAMNLCDILSH